LLGPQLLFLISDKLEKLQEDLLLLSPEHRIKAILDFAKFVIPTMKSIKLIAESDIQQLQILITTNFQWKLY